MRSSLKIESVMRQSTLAAFMLFGCNLLAQTDTTRSPLDNMTPEQLMQYYINEPEPPETFKGKSVGDTVFNELNPLTIPTVTVDAEPLSIHRYSEAGEELQLEEPD